MSEPSSPRKREVTAALIQSLKEMRAVTSALAMTTIMGGMVTKELEARVNAVMDSSKELLQSLDPDAGAR